MLTLLEASFVLLLGMILQIGQMVQLRNNMEHLITSGTAPYVARLQTAYNTYVGDYTAAIDGLTAGSVTPVSLTTKAGTSYTVANGLSPTVADLLSLGLLPSGYSSKSPMKQVFSVTLVPVNCPGVNCLVQGMMASNGSYKDGQGRIRSDMVGDVVSALGADAGATYSSNPSQIVGFGGAWLQANPLAGTPPAALFMLVGASSAIGNTLNQFYRRDGTLPLTADLAGGGYNVDNVANVNATGVLNGSTASLSTGTVQSATGNVQLADSSGNAANLVWVGNITSYGSISAVGWLKAGAIATPEAACSPNGISAFNADNSGQMLTCRGVWVPTGGRYELYGQYEVANGWVVPAPTCSQGGSGVMFLNAQSFAVDNTAAVNFGPAGGNGPWTISITDGNPSVGIAGSGMATTYCYY